MRYVCDAPGGKTWFRIETESEAVAESDVTSSVKGNLVEIDVRARHEQDRIDLTVRVPSRSHVKVLSEAGAIDVIGNLALAEVETNTGTIRTDVPTDAVRLNLLWLASRPRYFSDVELPKVKEKAGGLFEISGTIGDKKAKRDDRVELYFKTERGVVIFNVNPNLVPSDLRERPLTEAVRAIVRSGDSGLIDAVRKANQDRLLTTAYDEAHFEGYHVWGDNVVWVYPNFGTPSRPTPHVKLPWES